MTDHPPFDVGPSAPAEPSESELREQLAQSTAAVLGEWMAAQPWQRQGVGAICPRLARALYLADMTVDAMIGEAPCGDEQSEALVRELVGLPEPGPLLARLGRCTGTVLLPPDTVDADAPQDSHGAVSVVCGTRLVGGRCPFHAHHAVPR